MKSTYYILTILNIFLLQFAYASQPIDTVLKVEKNYKKIQAVLTDMQNKTANIKVVTVSLSATQEDLIEELAATFEVKPTQLKLPSSKQPFTVKDIAFLFLNLNNSTCEKSCL